MAAQIRFVSAGAGSGKTYALTQILSEELAGKRARPAGVIATTFTRKAAAELRERVRSHLIGEGEYQMANAMGQARIGTVNSVCGGLLERFAFEAGMPTELRVLDEVRASRLLGEAIDVAVESRQLTELLEVARRMGLEDDGSRFGGDSWRDALRKLLDQARANAIEAEALRGFGELNADQLLGHFPKPLDEDLDARLAAAIDAVLPQLRAAVASRGVKKTGEYLALVEQTRRGLEDGTLAWSQWNKLAGQAPEKGLQPLVEPVAEAAASYPRHRRLHEDVRRYLQLIFALAADALQAYADLKRRLGAIDFADQERLLLGILDHAAVAQTLGEELEVLMVDEFQDTSPIQLALFLKLAQFARQAVWVGDVKQAIYGFRGCDSILMKAVVDALPDLGGTKGLLPHSFRSRPSLVALVNEVFGPAFSGLRPKDVVLEPKRGELPATAAVEDWVLEGKNKDEQYEALASGIAMLIERGEHIEERDTGVRRPVRLGDIAVLARSNDNVKSIARVLRARRIACSTTQPGLLAQPEVVLVLACLRRLNDDGDTLATAEIVSLADCEEPEVWLADRLDWLERGKSAKLWKEADGAGSGHPILATLAELRGLTAVLSPREAVELVLARCGIVRRVIQWQQDSGQARLRLANVDRLVELATQYEDECDASREAATLSGLLLWLADLAAEKLDELPQPAIDAVHVMTHHGAKGLEWPVVVLCDLEGDVKDRLWDIEAQSRSGFDVSRPLQDRILRYWPWPFGAQKKVPVAEEIEASATGKAVRAEAIEEHKRLLYVSATRARDVLVLARPGKKLVGEWMETVGLDARLPAGEAAGITLKKGGPVPFRRVLLAADTADLPLAQPAGDLSWYEQPAAVSARPPLTVQPSSAAGVMAKVVETVKVGARIATDDAAAREELGNAVHACIAADLAAPAKPLSADEVQAILDRMGMHEALAAAAMHQQLRAIRQWLGSRWPGIDPIVELPVARILGNGQRVAGRTDLVLRTATAWIVFDHKSTPQGASQWEEVAQKHAGQLAAYRDVLEAVSGASVKETWLMLPVAGAALRVELQAEG
jgi:ATP-dependent exoDNAse (exonuclease V) beta subunit